jgi:NADPH:quinone reductase-like Zn-dependent oxidoreductase
MTYRAVVISRVGDPSVLEVVEKELTAPQPQQALVKIQYCGVGYTDVIMRSGYYPHAPKKMMPFVPGYEIVGTIEAVGSDLMGFKKGDTVCALTVTRGYAEYAHLNQDELIRLPEGVNVADAAALILNYVTAYQMLHREAAVKQGQTAFITGASGGVGTALLQLGKLAGLKMYGLTSAKKAEAVRQNGGIPIDYGSEDFQKVIHQAHADGIDAAIDALGGKYLWQSSKTLNKTGRVISYGMTSVVKSGKTDFIALIQSFGGLQLLKWLRGKDRVRFYGITDLYLKDKKPLKEDLAILFDLLKTGKIKPQIAQIFPLTEARQANELLESGRMQGKILLKCS